MERAARWMIGQAGLQPVMPEVPAGVDVAVRSGGGKRVVILTNYGEAVQTVTLPEAMTDVLGGGEVKNVQLVEYGVAVLRAK